VHPIRFLALTGTFLASTALAAPAPIPVTTCGQTVPAGKRGVLVADLDCTGHYAGVNLGTNARLLLDGRTITGATGAAVLCEKSCRVQGPGALSGSLTGASGYRVQVTGVDVSGNSIGINATTAQVADSTFTGNNEAIHAQRTARVSDSQLVGNPIFNVIARHAALRDVTISGGEIGIVAATAGLIDSSVDTTADGGETIDFRTDKRPRLRNSTCAGRSERRQSPSESWQICALD
jgi:hypothetical protein